MLTRLLRLLAPLIPRRRPHLFPTVRSDRSQTGLFRSRRLRPNPSPRPRTQPFQRRPAAPSQPQPSSPTRPKNPAQAISRHPHPIPAARHTPSASSDPRDRRLRCRGAPPGVPPRSRHIAPERPRPAAPCCPPVPHPGPSVAGRDLAPPRCSQKTPRRASRVFWKKLLLRARPPLSPLRSTSIASPSKHPTAPPVYTCRDRQALGAGVTANLNPTGAPRHSGRGPASGRYLPPGVERVQLSARNRRLRNRPDRGVHVSGQQHRRGLAKPRRPASHRPLRSR